MTINWTYAGGEALQPPAINLQTTIPTQSSGFLEQYRTAEKTAGLDELTAQIEQLTAQLLVVMKEVKLKTDEITKLNQAGC